MGKIEYNIRPRGWASARIAKIGYEAPKPVEAPKPSIQQMNACPKCGKTIGRGRYMHIKHCNANKG